MTFSKWAINFSSNVVFFTTLVSFSLNRVAEAKIFTDERVFHYLKERARKSGIYKSLDPEYLFSLSEKDIENKPLNDLVDMYVYLEERLLDSRTNMSDVPMYSPFLPSHLSTKDTNDGSATLSLPKSEIIPKRDVNNFNTLSMKVYKEDLAGSRILKGKVESLKANIFNSEALDAKNTAKASDDSFHSRILQACEKCLSKIGCNGEYYDESFERNIKKLQVRDKTKFGKKLSHIVNKVYKEYPAETAFRLISEKLNSCGAKLFKDYICENSLSDILDVFALEKIKSSDFESEDEFFKSLFRTASKLQRDIDVCSEYFRKEVGSSRSLLNKADMTIEKLEILEKLAEVFFRVYYVLAKNRETNIAFFYESFLFLIDNFAYVLELGEVSKIFLENFAKCLLNALISYGNLFNERIESHPNKARNIERKIIVDTILDSMRPLTKSADIIENMKKILLKWADEHKNEKGIFSEKPNTIENELNEMKKAGDFKVTFLDNK